MTTKSGFILFIEFNHLFRNCILMFHKYFCYSFACFSTSKWNSKLLTIIVFYHSFIEKIGDKPFYYLNNLIFLSLDTNIIGSITKTAFNFRDNSNEWLELELPNNNLNGKSFEIGSLINLKSFWRIIQT